jgi:hypothetical protein
MNKNQTLHELSVTIASLKNPQCHWDLANEDKLVLNIKLRELEDLFYLIMNSGDDDGKVS